MQIRKTWEQAPTALKCVFLAIGILFIAMLNLYVSHIIWYTAFDKLSRYGWYWDIVTKLNELIYPPLHHFEWNTLKPDNYFVWYAWEMIKLIIRNFPLYGSLYLLGNIATYAKRKTLPTKINLLMLPINYFKVTILAYLLTHFLIFPLDVLTFFEIILPEQSVSLAGPLCSHVFWLSIFFAWRQISHRDQPSKFHLPSFPKVSPSPTL